MHISDHHLATYNGLSKIVHNAMLMNTHKDKDFLQFLFDKGRLHFDRQKNPNQKAINEFYKLLDLFDAKYKNLYDLGFIYDGLDFYPYFKVLYPEFIITNSHGELHTIKDLVVVHDVAYNPNNGGHIYTKHPMGGRLSKTKLESAAAYQQSHLPSHSEWKHQPFYVTTFCVGGDTDVSRMIAEFEVEMDWDRYELYLFCVDSMITWESLEGVPYRKMRDIKNALNNKVTSANQSYVNTIVNKIISDKITLDVDFYIEKGLYRIRPNERANEFVKNLVLQCFTFDKYKTILVSRVPNTFSEFLQMKAEQQAEQDFDITVPKEYTIFRGKKVFGKLIKEDKRNEPVVSLENLIVYPNFLKDVLSQLESRIYSKAITKSGVKIYHSLSNANRSVSSDPVSV
jgi:hypothetical protein